MDTPDKAAGFADSQIANAVNHDWLVASGRSSQLSTDLKRYKIDCSSSLSLSLGGQHAYGAIPSSIATGQSTKNQPARPRSETESSWLLKHYMPTMSRKSETISAHNNGYSINNHLYDNISFADSPLLLSKSLSMKMAPEGAVLEGDTLEAGPPGKFRIFLSCYLLLGITLAIYSRNALSLAVVGMVANNELNSEMFNNLSPSNNSQNLYMQMAKAAASDNSCPVDPKAAAGRAGELYAKIASTSPLVAPSLYPSSPLTAMGDSSQLEAAYKASIRDRVARGELVDWSPGEQGLIFAAGSVGNLLIAIPLTRMGELYGAKWVIFAALFGATIQAALMPLISPCNLILVILFQVIFCGLTFGADCVAYTFFAHWLTPTEMAFFVSCLLICYQTGNIISSFVTAAILTRGIDWSWCFYAPAILCGAWTLVWAAIGASEPSTSCLISRKELSFLVRTSKLSEVLQGDIATDERETSGRKSRSSANNPTPAVSWLKLARDPNIWAIISVKFTLRWYFSVYASLMPTYLASVTHMSVDTIGNMSVVQSFIGLFTGILVGYLTKSVIVRRPLNLSLAAFRKSFQSIVSFGLALSLLLFTAFDCNQWVTIVTLTISGICINFYVAAALQLPLDLSPAYCGLITSISNTLALGQALGAPVSGWILDAGPKDRGLWRIVWGLVILLNSLSGLLFIFLVDAKPRDYNKEGDCESDGLLQESGRRRQANCANGANGDTRGLPAG